MAKGDDIRWATQLRWTKADPWKWGSTVERTRSAASARYNEKCGQNVWSRDRRAGLVRLVKVRLVEVDDAD